MCTFPFHPGIPEDGHITPLRDCSLFRPTRCRLQEDSATPPRPSVLGLSCTPSACSRPSPSSSASSRSFSFSSSLPPPSPSSYCSSSSSCVFLLHFILLLPSAPLFILPLPPPPLPPSAVSWVPLSLPSRTSSAPFPEPFPQEFSPFPRLPFHPQTILLFSHSLLYPSPHVSSPLTLVNNALIKQLSESPQPPSQPDLVTPCTALWEEKCLHLCPVAASLPLRDAISPPGPFFPHQPFQALAGLMEPGGMVELLPCLSAQNPRGFCVSIPRSCSRGVGDFVPSPLSLPPACISSHTACFLSWCWQTDLLTTLTLCSSSSSALPPLRSLTGLALIDFCSCLSLN